MSSLLLWCYYAILIIGKVSSWSSLLCGNYYQQSHRHSSVPTVPQYPVGTTRLSPLHARAPSSISPIDDSYWYEYKEGQSLVLYPKSYPPKAIIHFIGGFISGSSIQLSYSTLLTTLASHDYFIIATPIPWIELNHEEVAKKVNKAFSQCYYDHALPLIEGFGPKERARTSSSNMRQPGGFGTSIPIIGLSHSLGGKLTTIINCRAEYRKLTPKKHGNVFLAFNNYGFAQTLRENKDKDGMNKEDGSNPMDMLSSIAKGVVGSIETFANAISFDDSDDDYLVPNPSNRLSADQISNTFANMIDSKVEFTPSPVELWNLMSTEYKIPRSYLFKFQDDAIDQSDIAAQFIRRSDGYAEIHNLPGNHLTPNLILPQSIYEFIQQVKTWDGIEYSTDSSTTWASSSLDEQNGLRFLTTLLQVLDRISESSLSSNTPLIGNTNSASKSMKKPSIGHWDTDEV